MPATHSAESGGSGAMTALTHALPWVLAVGLVMRVASWFGWLTWLDLGVGVVLLTCSAATLLHRGSANLCVRCMEEVPADAPDRAHRRRSLLWFAHLVTSPIGIGALVIPVVALSVLGTAFGGPTIERLARLPLDVTLFATMYAAWMHHRLRPWCPYCRDWDQDGDLEPSPDPSEFGIRTGH